MRGLLRPTNSKNHVYGCLERKPEVSPSLSLSFPKPASGKATYLPSPKQSWKLTGGSRNTRCLFVVGGRGANPSFQAWTALGSRSSGHLPGSPCGASTAKSLLRPRSSLQPSVGAVGFGNAGLFVGHSPKWRLSLWCSLKPQKAAPLKQEHTHGLRNVLQLFRRGFLAFMSNHGHRRATPIYKYLPSCESHSR